MTAEIHVGIKHDRVDRERQTANRKPLEVIYSEKDRKLVLSIIGRCELINSANRLLAIPSHSITLSYQWKGCLETSPVSNKARIQHTCA